MVDRMNPLTDTEEDSLLIQRYAYDTFATPRELVEIEYLNLERKLKHSNFSMYCLSRFSVLVMLLIVIFVLYMMIFSYTEMIINIKNYDNNYEPNVTSKNTTNTSQPNFIFILVDDLSWNSMGYMDYDLSFATPFLTQLANNGIIMSNYYTQEICTPSRASLMTGKYPISIGMQYGEIQPTQQWGLPLKETILPQVLQRYGYKNYMVGKWNLGHYSSNYLPTARGFDEYLGFLGAEEFYWSKAKIDNINLTDFIHSNRTCYDKYSHVGDETMYSTKLYEAKMLDIIDTHDFTVNPMFLYFSSQAVHAPFNDKRIIEYNRGIPESYIGINQ